MFEVFLGTLALGRKFLRKKDRVDKHTYGQNLVVITLPCQGTISFSEVSILKTLSPELLWQTLLLLG